jgi:hypothetical protein
MLLDCHKSIARILATDRQSNANKFPYRFIDGSVPVRTWQERGQDLLLLLPLLLN